MTASLASSLLLEARARAGLSQRELARRASTSRSAIARIERGVTDPSIETLRRLLAAAGFEIRAELTAAPVANPHGLDDVPRILSLTPEQRLDEVARVSHFIWSARRV
jgi:transcriptional regulator with XRE-family HTH domain